jgi:hypothetical protein
MTYIVMFDWQKGICIYFSETSFLIAVLSFSVEYIRLFLSKSRKNQKWPWNQSDWGRGQGHRKVRWNVIIWWVMDVFIFWSRRPVCRCPACCKEECWPDSVLYNFGSWWLTAARIMEESFMEGLNLLNYIKLKCIES